MTMAVPDTRWQPVDVYGKPYPAAKLYVYQAGTTNPVSVFSDAGLSTPHTNPVIADGNGRFPVMYTSAQLLKIVLATASDSVLETRDNVDPGLGIGSGVLGINQGGTGASTAAGARASLGAAPQSAVDAVTSSVSDLEGLVASGLFDETRFGLLAKKDKFTFTDAATGGPVQIVQRLVSERTDAWSTSATIPLDDTIPQSSEGSEYFNQSITPKVATSKIVVTGRIPISINAGFSIVAVFVNSETDARFADSMYVGAAGHSDKIDFRMEFSPGVVTPQTIIVRIGANSGTVYVNGYAGRKFGGVSKSYLIIEEHLTP